MNVQTPLSALLRYSLKQRSELLAALTREEAQELADILEQEANRELWERIKLREAAWDRGPLLWMTRYTLTEDTHALAKGTPFKSPFPKNEYLRVVMQYMLSEDALMITKSRELMMSWEAVAKITWECQFHDVFWLAQTGKEDKVADLVGYGRILYNNQSDWMKKKNPLVVDNATELKWASGGRFLGIPKGEAQARMYHPHGYFQDESAFLPEAQQAFDAVRPVARQMLCVSTDEMGFFHDETRLEG